MFEQVGIFRDFLVFNYGPYTEIKNSENSEISSRLRNLNNFFLFEETGNFGSFRLFDFARYTEIENLENSESNAWKG